MESLKMCLFCLKLPKFRNIHDKMGLFSILLEVRQGKIYKSEKPRRGKSICCLNFLHPWGDPVHTAH